MLAGATLCGACNSSTPPEPKPAASTMARPSILLVSLDTTRADSIGPEAVGVITPVSSFALARRFGLARGFDVYDDELPRGRAERGSEETTRRAIGFLLPRTSQPT